MTRPSLLQTAETSQNVNVLDAIHAPAVPARQRPPAMRRMVWALVPFAVVGLWLALSDPGIAPLGMQAVVSNTPRPSSSAGTSKVAVAAEPVVVDSVAIAPRPMRLQAETSGAAPFEALAAPSPPLALPQPAQRSARLAAAPVPKIKPASAPKPPSQTVIASRPKAERTTRAASQATARAPAAAIDPDVALLSALMQHMGSTKPKAPTAGTRAEQLSECRRTDRADATTCQQRVCAGAWGLEKSCPAHLAPDPRTNTRASAAPD